MAKASTVAVQPARTLLSSQGTFDLPNLVDHQTTSFQWFVEEGLTELFSEISPIEDYTGTKLSIRFKEYRFEEPKMTEREARENNVSFDAPLYANID